WSAPAVRALWQRALRAVDEGRMPPPPLPRLAAPARQALSSYLTSQLTRHTPFGGELPRRLNGAEYQATIRELFDLPKFRLPLGFPPDVSLHGFDNLAAGLTLSAPLLEAYAATASEIADTIFPPPGRPPQPRRWQVPPDDMVISFSASTVRNGILRMASRAEDVMRSCTWPARVEIVDSGLYRLTITASRFAPRPGQAMTLELWAREVDDTDRSNTHAFRRPVDDATRETFLNIATRHWQQGHSFEEGMHLLLRSILISPRFLYRDMQPGALDAYDPASHRSPVKIATSAYYDVVNFARRVKVPGLYSWGFN
ncbi:MAG: DUF1587 domain-containing protein, partial [Acidobacteriota bacterium]